MAFNFKFSAKNNQQVFAEAKRAKEQKAATKNKGPVKKKKKK